MSAIWKVPALPPPDAETVLRYARGAHSAGVDDLLREVLQEGSALVEARLCYAIFDITVCKNTVDFGAVSVESRYLANHLAGYRRAVLFAATVGAGADRAIARAERVSPARALLLDAFFSERVETLCDSFTAGFNDPARRFSPGYGDLPLDFQKDLFRVLDCPRRIGLTLGENLLMIPTKSVTAIIGVKESLS